MILIEAAGGFGNQLQQYAFYKKLESLGADVRLDLHWFSKEVQETAEYKRSFSIGRLNGISFRKASEKDREKLLGSGGLSSTVRKIKGRLLPASRTDFTESSIYHEELMDRIRKNPDTDLYIRGFFACEAYYADLLPAFRDTIAFPIDTDPLLSRKEKEDILKLSEEIADSCSISLHVRLGDYLDEANRALFGGICTKEYYRGALSHVLSEAFPGKRNGDSSRTDKGKPSLYVFSDDPSGAEGFIREIVSELQKTDDPVINGPAGALTVKTVDICHGENSLYDVYLMSLCRHNICANSTFSFWGARFNAHEGKIMIRPEKHKNSQSFDPDLMKRLWPGWSFVSDQGTISLRFH